MKNIVLSCLALVSLSACHVENGYYYESPNDDSYVYREHRYQSFENRHRAEKVIVIPNSRSSSNYHGHDSAPSSSTRSSNYHGHDSAPSSATRPSNSHGHDSERSRSATESRNHRHDDETQIIVGSSANRPSNVHGHP